MSSRPLRSRKASCTSTRYAFGTPPDDDCRHGVEEFDDPGALREQCLDLRYRVLVGDEDLHIGELGRELNRDGREIARLPISGIIDEPPGGGLVASQARRAAMSLPPT